MIIKRKVVSKILKFIKEKEIIAIHGARQVGKTSVLQYLIEHHLSAMTIKKNIFYLDLEDFVLLEVCNKGAEETVRYLKAKGADFSRKIFLLIDEIQYLDNPYGFLKLLYDRYAPKIKLIVSGSSSFDIKRKFKDSLAGRIIDYELFTLDFEEFLEFKGKAYDLSIAEAASEELKPLYEEYVLFGGYPAIVLSDANEKKELKLKQIISAYVKKDIKDIAAIRNLGKFNDLLQMLAMQSGGLMNVAELSNSLRLAKQTVEEYLFILESTYIIKIVRPFHKNIRSELTKMPKVYFEDTGMLNLLVNKTFSQTLSGQLFETSIFGQLRRNMTVSDIYFWRLAKGSEVDFILQFPSKKVVVPVEVKTLCLDKHFDPLKYFQSEYKSRAGYVCCFDKRTGNKQTVFPWGVYSIIDAHRK
jgi:uncharacterized protein